MKILLLLVALLAFSVVAHRLGRSRALAGASSVRDLHSLPGYYGLYAALWCALPALLLVLCWISLEPAVVERMTIEALPEESRELDDARLGLLVNDIKNLASGNIVSREVDPALQAAADHYSRLRRTAFMALVSIVALLACGGFFWAFRRISPRLAAIHRVERVVRGLLMLGSAIAILTTVGIVLSLLFESIRFFQRVPMSEFLFGLEWSPQTALRADQVGASGAFGAIPLLTGTLLVSALAMSVAAPVGLLSAIYMAEYASDRARKVLKPVLEILAGVPTVVYGFFAALTVAPAIRRFGESMGLDVASESALAAGAVMGVMIIPFVSSLSDDVITAVPRGLREASYGLGATQNETIRRVVFPAALPGIVGGLLLAVSRAIGETMIVVMAAGLAANLTINPLEAVTTVTVQIVTLLVGDQEFESAKTLSAFALGLLLFIVTLVLNVIALRVVRKYREQYD
ncbi:MAG: phosphate ABC transporter permease subunit PstC [Acidobacteriota bacterium]